MKLSVSPQPDGLVVIRGRMEGAAIGDFYRELAPGDELLGQPYDFWKGHPGLVEVSEIGEPRQVKKKRQHSS